MWSLCCECVSSSESLNRCLKTIMELELISTSYVLSPSQWYLCLHDYPPIVARQQPYLIDHCLENVGSSTHVSETERVSILR
jgi:hypothetical protein